MAGRPGVREWIDMRAHSVEIERLCAGLVVRIAVEMPEREGVEAMAHLKAEFLWETLSESIAAGTRHFDGSGRHLETVAAVILALVGDGGVWAEGPTPVRTPALDCPYCKLRQRGRVAKARAVGGKVGTCTRCRRPSIRGPGGTLRRLRPAEAFAHGMLEAEMFECLEARVRAALGTTGGDVGGEGDDGGGGDVNG